MNYFTKLVFYVVLAGFLFKDGDIAKAQSLQQTLIKAYLDNPQIKAARAELRASDEGVAQALGLKRPTVNSSLQSTYERNDYSDTIADQSRPEHQLTLSVDQTLYDSGRRHASVQAADASVLASRYQLLSTEQSVLLSAATAYLDLLRDQAVLALREKNVKRLERQLEAAEDRFEVGEVSRTDVAQAKGRLANAVADEISARGQVQISKTTYERVVGSLPEMQEDATDLEPSSMLQTVDLIVTIPETIEDVKAQTLQNNPDLLGSRYALTASRQQVAIEKADLLPQLQLNGSTYLQEQIAGNDVETEGFTFGATLSVPLYQAGIASSELRASRSNAVSAAHDFTDTQRAVIETAATTWENYQSSQALITANEAVLEANQLTLEGIEQELMLGTRTILDILDAEQDVMDTEVELVRTHRDLKVLTYQLASVMGAFNAATLELNVEQYDPSVNYQKTRTRYYGWGEEEEPDYIPPASVIIPE